MKIDINKVAQLANLPLSEEEKKDYQPQLEEIISFVDKLNKLDTENVNPTSQVTGKINELREDVPGKTLDTNQTIQNAPKIKDSYIVTKGVLDPR